ncbi:Glycerophosphocholine acyltransferase 1 [Entamoeba marina]
MLNEEKYQKDLQQQYILRTLKKNGIQLIDKYQDLINEFTESEPFLKLIDKFTFASGVLILLLSQHIISALPTFMPYYYLILIFPLLLARYFIYRKNKWHYFMIDFCYFCQLITILTVALVNTSLFPYLFQTAFVFAHGPLLTAIPMWKNSLVFHDLDKLTSVYIHLFPALVCYSLRWYVISSPPEITLLSGIIIPSIIYILWQCAYLFITEGVDKDKIERRRYMTSLKWLSQEKPHPIYLFLLKKGVKDRPLVILVSFQFAYTILTMLPTYIYYNSKSLELLWILICLACSIWMGANFYFEVFIRNYSKRLENNIKAFKQSEAAIKKPEGHYIITNQKEQSN